MFISRSTALTLTVIAMTMPGCSQQSSSDQDSRFVQQLKQNQGISVDEDAAVDMAETACDAPTAGVGLYDAQQAMHQRYPEYDANTVAIVMAQGVLAYCPERLP